MLIPGYLLYGLVYLGFGLLSSKPAVILLFFAYGVCHALISGAERAFIVERAPAELSGTMLGFYGMLQGIGLLLSSLIAGLLWDTMDSNAPFLFGGVIGVLSAVMILIIMEGNGRVRLLRK